MVEKWTFFPNDNILKRPILCPVWFLWIWTLSPLMSAVDLPTPQWFYCLGFKCILWQRAITGWISHCLFSSAHVMFCSAQSRSISSGCVWFLCCWHGNGSWCVFSPGSTWWKRTRKVQQEVSNIAKSCLCVVWIITVLSKAIYSYLELLKLTV